MQDIKKQLNHCQMQLIKQAEAYPITGLSFDQVDRCLKEFVHCQRKYLSRRNNEQLVQFKDDIHEKDLLKTISTNSLTNDQVSVPSFQYNRYVLLRKFSCSMDCLIH